MRHSHLIVFSLLTLALFVAAACNSGGGGTTGAGTDGQTPAQDATDQALAATVADGWAATAIDNGIKPDLALDGAGSPAVAYLFEDVGEGFVRFASAGDGWTPETVVEGYFYGPIGLAFDPDGQPNVVYHDHQASQFQEDLGDLTYALRGASGWRTESASDDGHDGWDSTIAIAPDGVVRAAGIDPSQFGSVDGVEYYERSDGNWTVTSIGSGPIAYEWNVSLAVAPDGLPALTYYNDRDGDLVFAAFDGSAWNLETVASEGDAGKFSSLSFDSQGRPHVTFFDDQGGGSGQILYATRGDGGWTVEEIGALDSVVQGMTGARRITSLALDAQDVPHVAFSDESVIRYATRSDAGWQVEDIVTAGDRPLGQLVSLRLDGTDTPHLAFFEVTSGSPLDGLIVYLTLSTS